MRTWTRVLHSSPTGSLPPVTLHCLSTWCSHVWNKCLGMTLWKLFRRDKVCRLYLTKRKPIMCSYMLFFWHKFQKTMLSWQRQRKYHSRPVFLCVSCQFSFWLPTYFPRLILPIVFLAQSLISIQQGDCYVCQNPRQIRLKSSLVISGIPKMKSIPCEIN